jgi:hypothetical protein
VTCPQSLPACCVLADRFPAKALSSERSLKTSQIKSVSPYHGVEIGEAFHQSGVFGELLLERIGDIVRRISGYQQYFFPMFGHQNSQTAAGNSKDEGVLKQRTSQDFL